MIYCLKSEDKYFTTFSKSHPRRKFTGKSHLDGIYRLIGIKLKQIDLSVLRGKKESLESQIVL